MWLRAKNAYAIGYVNVVVFMYFINFVWLKVLFHYSLILSLQRLMQSVMKTDFLLSVSICVSVALSECRLFLRVLVCDEVCERLTKRVWEKEQTERQKHMYCVFVSRPVNEIYGLNCVCVRVRVCVFWHVWRGVWASRGKAHKTHDHTDEVTGSETGESLSFPVSFHPSLSYLHSSISRLYSCFSVFLTLCFYGIFQYVTRHWKTRKGVFWWLMIAFSINQALVLTLKLCCLHQDFLLRMCSHTWCTFVSSNGYGFLSFICLHYFSKKQK